MAQRRKLRKADAIRPDRALISLSSSTFLFSPEELESKEVWDDLISSKQCSQNANWAGQEALG